MNCPMFVHREIETGSHESFERHTVDRKVLGASGREIGRCAKCLWLIEYRGDEIGDQESTTLSTTASQTGSHDCPPTDERGA